MQCIVADSGPLIALAGVELLHLPTALFESAFITEAVLAESLGDIHRPGAAPILEAVSAGLIEVGPVLRRAREKGYFLGDALIRQMELLANE
ncbi:MAG: hypothetical protein IPJ33_01810 [Gammaproteobacteria bacterium]|jgi:predicted nucleic acid-binding protein|nr:hypothetical protein [Gammaproteobacteria bacterium]MBK7522260.1 hypothetical protein [Gammaproteobacteria bacterium]MBK7727256.1 hypothetical protein [Gammaproteobacteria bacterium]MBK9665269.1 hypothetical protein [Gammaproteobacteria bacterium]